MSVLKSEIPHDDFSADTSERLLEAAGEVFAKNGFHNATIRDICKRAGANIAAINYHFGDKQGLYIAVLKYAHRCAFEKYPTDMGLGRNVAPDERLSAFIRSFLCRILEEGSRSWHGRLMLREMAEPTAALDVLVEDTIRPHFNLLNSIVKDLLGPSASQQGVRAAAFSIVGQCLFYCHARPVINRLVPRQRFGLKEIERLAGHISTFSLAAIKNFNREQEKAL